MHEDLVRDTFSVGAGDILGGVLEVAFGRPSSDLAVAAVGVEEDEVHLGKTHTVEGGVGKRDRLVSNDILVEVVV
jgi:hypothetical protein